MNVTIENFIGVYENALSPDFCRTIIEHFENADAVGLTSTRQKYEDSNPVTDIDDTHLYTEYSLAHLNPVTQFTNFFWEFIYPSYANKYGTLKGADRHSNYAFKIQRTNVGQGYHVWHFESSGRSTSNRVLVWTLYLNDVEEGGETEFLYYPKRIKPKTGTLVLWPASFTHSHRGNPPLSNTKYIVTGWLEF